MAGVRPILLISGPPGAGKSSVARELVKTATAPPILIEGDTFWSFLAKGRAKPTKKQLTRQPLTVMQAMMAATRPFTRNGYEVIVDFSIGPWFLPGVRPYLRDAPLDFVVLCPSKAVCARRAADRKEGRMPDYGPYETMYDAFANAADFAQYTIRDDKMPVAKLAAYIRGAVAEGSFRVS
jgi:chloramphenicol 3-O-phosphotransferase